MVEFGLINTDNSSTTKWNLIIGEEVAKVLHKFADLI